MSATTATDLKEPKKVDPSKFASGWSLMSKEQWLVLIATEHARIKYPGFYPLCPGQNFEEIDLIDLSPAQKDYCNDYWDNVLKGPSEGALAARRALTRGQRTSYCEALDSKIFIIEWDAVNNRAKRGTGQWVSYRGTKPSFRFGIIPKSGKIGGWKVEDTLRPKVDKISIRSKAALIEESSRLIGCDTDEAKRIFEHRGKNKKDGFYKFHGHGLWSGTHPDVANPTAEEIEKASVLLSAEKANRKPKTDIQVKLWTLFVTMPPKHVNDIPAWLIEDPERVAILEAFQAASTVENIKEMDLEEYAYYKWRNLCNTVRDENMMPTVQVGRSRHQGKLYIEPPEVTAAKVKKAEKDRQHEKDMADITAMVCADPVTAVPQDEPQQPPEPEESKSPDDIAHEALMARIAEEQEALAAKREAAERREQSARWYEHVKKLTAEKQKQKKST